LKLDNDSKLTFFAETVLGNKKDHALFFTNSTASRTQQQVVMGYLK